MFKKSFFVLNFLFMVVLLMAASCGSEPKPNLVTPTPASLTFNLQIGESNLTTFNFENDGDAALQYTLSENSLEIKLDKTSGNLNSGGSDQITVSVTCKQPGTSTENIALASNGGDATIAVTFTCNSAPSSRYNIELSFVGDTTTDEQKTAFEQAELRWEGIITSEFPDIELPAVSDVDPRFTVFCDDDETDLTGKVVDELLIYAKVGTIDGPGNILAQAGPILFRSADELTLLGCMIFDIEDINLLVKGGSFADVVTHEMGHVLGIGTLWGPEGKNLFDKACPSNVGVGFSGAKSIIEFGVLQNSFNKTLPPIETEFGRGTACGHWDEGFFANELMTGFAEAPGVNMPLTALTVASLKDLGYDVDYSQASNNYSLPACRPTCELLGPQVQEQPWEILLAPIAAIGNDGNIHLLGSPR
jgi:hypothetical protein